jgi:Ca-activated chloride channel family protein
MEAAKTAARQFAERQPTGISIGVVVFSDGGISVQAPTDNRDETLAIDAGDPPILQTNDLSQDPAVAPVEAPQGWYPSAIIVLFTDGENNQEPDPIMASQVAADLGVRVYTVGVGTPGGTNIEVEGMTVHTALDETMLQYIALESGGMYYNAGDEEQLRRIYSDIEPKLAIKPEEIEMTSVFAGLGMIVFLIGGMLSLLWFGHVP